MASMFVAYRRKDSAGWSGRLYDALERSFPRADIFRDVDSLQIGQKWSTQLEQEIDSANLFILVIGPTWSSSPGLHDPADVHRKEIERALLKQRPILPVCVGHASLPDASDLPVSLQPILEWQAAHLSEDGWSDDYVVLERRIRKVIGHDDVSVRLVFAGATQFGSSLDVWWDGRMVGSGTWGNGFDIHVDTAIGEHQLAIEQVGKVAKLMNFPNTLLPVRIDQGGSYRADVQFTRATGDFSVRLTASEGETY